MPVKDCRNGLDLGIGWAQSDVDWVPIWIGSELAQNHLISGEF